VLAGFALGAGTRPGDGRSWRAVVAAVLIIALCGAYAVVYRRAYFAMVRNSHDREFALADLYAEGGPTRDTLLFLYPPGIEHAKARVERFSRLHLGPFAPGMRATGERLAAEVRPVAQPRDVQGIHQTSDCQFGATGWAWDRANPNHPVRLNIFDGDVWLDTTTADWFSQELLNMGIGDGRHVFRYALADALKDGKPHMITVRVAGTGAPLTQTPRMVICNARS